MTTAQRLAELAAEGLSQKDAANTLGVSKQRVSQVARKHGIAFTKRFAPQVSKRIERLQAECNGMTVAQAARHLGVSPSMVRGDVKKSGFNGLVPTNTRRPRSERTKRILERAPKLAAAGYSKSEAASKLDVPPPALTNAMRLYAPDVQWRDGRRGK